MLAQQFKCFSGEGRITEWNIRLPFRGMARDWPEYRKWSDPEARLSVNASKLIELSAWQQRRMAY